MGEKGGKVESRNTTPNDGNKQRPLCVDFSMRRDLGRLASRVQFGYGYVTLDHRQCRDRRGCQRYDCDVR